MRLDEQSSGTPFPDSINPQALYPHEAFQDVLAELAQAKISDREGATLITGAHGAGKTSLVARLLSEAERAEGSLRLAGSEDLTFSRFLKLCAEGFGLPAEFANAKDHLKALSAFLVERARSGRSSTIVIDPADSLNARFLGELSEFATWSKAGRRLSNVILIGQGTPGGQAGPKFAGVKIALHCHLLPLLPGEVGPYLAHHLRIAGMDRPDMLEPDVAISIAERGSGLPGKINELARAVLWAAPADSGVAITTSLVAEAAHKLEAGLLEDDEDDEVEPFTTLEAVVAREFGSETEEASADLPPEILETSTAATADDGEFDEPGIDDAGTEEAPGQAWPLDLAASERLGSEKLTPEEVVPEKIAPEKVAPEKIAPNLAPVARASRRRAGRFWLGMGASGLAAGLLLVAALHEVWPEKITRLMEGYELSLPSMDQVAETFKPAKQAKQDASGNLVGDQNLAGKDQAGSAGEGSLSGEVPAKPLLAISAEVGREDRPLSLQLSTEGATDKDLAGLKVTVAGLPSGARLSAGARDNTGLWHLASEDLSGLTLMPPTDYSGNFGLAVSVAAQQPDGEVAYSTQALPIHIKAVPDVPLLHVGKAEGEDGDPVPLDIQADLVDKDGSEILTLFLSNLPEGARLSAGKVQADGSWLLEPQEISGLRLIPPRHLSGNFTLTVMALASERNGGSTPAKLPLSLQLKSRGAVPQLTVAPVAGPEGEALSLALAASLKGPDGLARQDGSESLYLLFDGLPKGARLTAGQDIGDGVWRVEEDALPGLKILPPSGWSGGFDLDVTAVAQASDGREVTANDQVPVRFDPAPERVAEAPSDPTLNQAEEALQGEAKLLVSKTADQEIASQEIASQEITSQEIIGEDFDIAKGDSLLAAKDVVAARQYFKQAQAQGNAKAMTALGMTYDPRELERLGIPESESDESLARHWYLQGVAAGDLAAIKRLRALSGQQ